MKKLENNYINAYHAYKNLDGSFVLTRLTFEDFDTYQMSYTYDRVVKSHYPILRVLNGFKTKSEKITI